MVIRLLLLILGLAAAPLSAEEAARLEIIVGGPAKPVAGEMIPVVIRGEYDLVITLEDMLMPEGGDFDWVQLERDSWNRERPEGKDRLVVERSIAIYPHRAGRLSFGPVTHRLTVAEGGGRAVREVTASAVAIEVAPFPAQSVNWPLSAAAVDVSDDLSTDPAALRDGETLVRTVTMTMLGPLAPMLPPRPALREPWLITFAAPEIRKTAITPDGPVSTVTWTWQIRPKTGEPGVVAGVDIPWFNTATRAMGVIRLDPVPLGYASFATNLGGAARFPASEIALLAGAFVAGLAVGLLVLTVGQRPVGVQGLRRILHRFLPSREVSRIRRAGRSGDLKALLGATMTLLSDTGMRVSPQTRRGLDQLHARIYARVPDPTPFDATGFVRSVLRDRRKGDRAMH